MNDRQTDRLDEATVDRSVILCMYVYVQISSSTFPCLRMQAGYFSAARDPSIYMNT